MDDRSRMPAQATTMPAEMFAAYQPSEENPWNVRKAAHLLRRVTFGATADRLDAILKLTPIQAIDSLLDYDPQADPFGDMVEKLEGLMTLDSPDNVQRWWIYRMLYSPQPAQEKIALFWHGRFATSAAKVSNPIYMANQIDLFRRMGQGSFRDLLIAVSRDPAMLVWLDGQFSHKGHPNENYGREVMELFTLGVGNYSEKDVQELARAFTGWRIQNNQGVFDPKQFDDGDKTIFGKTGKFDSEGAVDLLLAHPAAPKFLSRHLLCEFVHPHPTDEMIDFYAQKLLDEKWEIKPVLKHMLASQLFFSDWAYCSKIKAPSEIAIGGTLAVGGKINVDFVKQSMARMGQTLLFPPNVKGWDGEEAWINANTVLVRFNYGMMIATQNQFARRSDIEAMLVKLGDTDPAAIIDYYSRLLLDGRMDAKAHDELAIYMTSDDKGNIRPFHIAAGQVNGKVRGMIHLMMSTPEFQLA